MSEEEKKEGLTSTGSAEDAFHAAEYFTWDDEAETIDFTSYGDALGDYVDQHDLMDVYTRRTVTIYAFVKEVVTDSSKKICADKALEHLLERLDDTYRSGYCDYSEPTPAMTTAAREFVDKVLETYEVFNCKKVGERTFDVVQWILEHEPERLKEVTDVG